MPVNAKLFNSASKSHQSFAIELTAAGLSAGIVLSLVSEGRDSVPLQDRAVVTGKLTLADVLNAFSEHHPRYAAHVSDGVVSVRPTGDNICSSVLAKQIGPLVLASDLRSSMAIIVHAIDPSQRLPGPREGELGSVLSRPGEVPPLSPNIPISVSLPRASVEQTLNGLVKSAPGTAWLLEERRDHKGDLVCNLRVQRKHGGFQSSANLGR